MQINGIADEWQYSFYSREKIMIKAIQFAFALITIAVANFIIYEALQDKCILPIVLGVSNALVITHLSHLQEKMKFFTYK